MRVSERLDKIRKIMDEKGFDAFFVTSPESHLYFSGFDNPDGCLLIFSDCAVAFEDFRYTEAAKRTVSKDDFQVVMPTGKRSSWLSEALHFTGAHTVAFEDGFVTCRELQQLKKDCRGFDFVPVGDAVQRLRLYKDENEVRCIEKAQRIAEKSFRELLELITYDCTETYLAAQLEFLMRKNGSEGASFETIAVSGKNSSSPHGVPRNVKIEKGFLTFDFGATVGGYHSDMTRTLSVGRATPEMRRVYDTVLCAQKAVLEVIGAGMSCFGADKIARDIINSAGYEGCFGHSLGHGVGLQIHELPNLSPSAADKKLEAGQVVTVEPGIYIEGKFGCRTEDMVLITENGCRNLTEFPKEIMEI